MKITCQNSAHGTAEDPISAALCGIIPPQWFAQWKTKKITQWTPQKVVWVSIVMHWLPEQGLRERFEKAKIIVAILHPRWKLPKSYSAFQSAQSTVWECLGKALTQKLRPDASWNAHWLTDGWLVLAVDGTQITCPRTEDLEDIDAKFSGQSQSCPHAFQTTLMHVGTGLPWDFRVGPGLASERRHLDDMLPGLPENSLLTADAGFISFNLCHALMSSGKSFVLRAAGNMRLVEGLSKHCGDVSHLQHVDLVCLWPKEDNDRQPVLLRRVTVMGACGIPIVLLTNILDPHVLSDETLQSIYRLRWGIEIHFRTFKQTWNFTKLNSRTPATVLCEQRWRVISMWFLQWLGARALADAGESPRRLSGASLRRAIRARLDDVTSGKRGGMLSTSLSACLVDCYVRTSSKTRRKWPAKRKMKHPTPPKLRTASTTEIATAKQLGFRLTL